ncbi:MAG: NAD(P)-dependent oxidoreductase, partial [Spirochaetaceae bacterium]
MAVNLDTGRVIGFLDCMSPSIQSNPKSELPFVNVGITGATGTVAAEFIRLLAGRAHGPLRVTASCRDVRSRKAQAVAAMPGVSLVEGSIVEPRVAKQIVSRSDVVYHLAAWLANTTMPASYEEIFAINALSTAVIARLCARERKRLVFASSHSVYFAGAYEGVIAEDTYSFRRDFIDWIDAVKPVYSGLADRIIAAAPAAAPLDAIRAIHDRFPLPLEPLIYGKDEYHLYCLSKLLAEAFVPDDAGCVLRLSNVYGPGDDSMQAIGELCRRLLSATPGDRVAVRQPFKKIVPAYIGDIGEALLRAASTRITPGFRPVFTIASQPNYLREDALLSAVAEALARIRGDGRFRIERL